MTGLSKTLAATERVWTKLGAPKTPHAMDLIPATADCSQEGPARIITTVPLPPRNTRDNLEAPTEVPTAPRAPGTSKAATGIDANLDARTFHTVPLPLRNTRNDPEAPTTTRAPGTSKAATRIEANVVTKVNERITPQTG